MDLTEMVMIKLIFVILIVHVGCAAIGDVDGGARTQWNKKDLNGMRERSYEHTPQEFLQHFGPKDQIDVYEIFRTLYLEAFVTEEQPSHTVTDKQLLDLGHEFELSRCRTPRMKMIDLYEELGIAPDIIISPPAANVSRCGSNSGCCPKGQTCYHTGDNFKNKTITILYIEGNDISVKRYNVPEHGECECTTLTQSSSSAIPTVGDYPFNTSPFICHKRCISYFKQDPYCQCNVCDPDNFGKCDRLKKGRRQLSEVEARCVDSGECETPMCNPGLSYSNDERKCILDETFESI